MRMNEQVAESRLKAVFNDRVLMTMTMAMMAMMMMTATTTMTATTMMITMITNMILW